MLQHDCRFFHRLCRGAQYAVINARTGAWLGGQEEPMQVIADYLAATEGRGCPMPRIDAPLMELIKESGITEPAGDDGRFQPSLAVVHIGHRCNLACSYCYAPRNRESMSRPVIDATVKFLASLSGPLFVQFMGGEPLLHLEQVRQLIEGFRQKRSRYETTYGIQTNGLCLAEQGVLPMLREHEISFGISFDGPRGMSRARYGDRTEMLERRLEETMRRLHGEGCEFGLLCVLNASNVDRLEELLDWCLAEGIDQLLINPLLPGRGRDEYAITALQASNALRKLFRCWVDHRFYTAIAIENFQHFEDNLASTTRQYMCRKYPCGAGVDQLAIDSNGDVYPCDYLVGTSEFRAGSVLRDSPEAIADAPLLAALRSQRDVSRLSRCGACPFFSICGHCMSSSYFHGQGVAGPRASCEADRAVIEDILFELLINQDYCDHVTSR